MKMQCNSYVKVLLTIDNFFGLTAKVLKAGFRNSGPVHYWKCFDGRSQCAVNDLDWDVL